MRERERIREKREKARERKGERKERGKKERRSQLSIHHSILILFFRKMRLMMKKPGKERETKRKGEREELLMEENLMTSMECYQIGPFLIWWRYSLSLSHLSLKSLSLVLSLSLFLSPLSLSLKEINDPLPETLPS